MAKIGNSLDNPQTHFIYNQLEYKKGSWELFYTNKINKSGTKDLDKNLIKVGIRNTYNFKLILQTPINILNWKGLSGEVFNTLEEFLLYVVPIINFNLDTGVGLSQKVVAFGDLVSGTLEGDLAYVENSQGVKWLPSTLGGTYYPAGWYIWTGLEWVSDRNAIANQLEQNIFNIDSKADTLHNHIKADITDFNESDYATEQQGQKADLVFGWGDHSLENYLLVETDPIFQSSEASSFVEGDKSKLDNQSGINTGDETIETIQTKRPIKSINNTSLEGGGDISILDIVSNNSGQIKLNWSILDRPSTVAGFTAGVAQSISLNSNYSVSSSPTTTFPYLADNTLGGGNLISNETLLLRELLQGQTIIFRVKAGYLNKVAGQNGNFTIRMFNPNPLSSFEIIKSIPTPDGTTTYEEEFEFIAIADELSLGANFGYGFEMQSTFNDADLVGYITNITALYIPTELFLK